jgi:hypothetical protein
MADSDRLRLATRTPGGNFARAVAIGMLDLALYVAGILLTTPYGHLAIAGSIAAVAFTTFFGVLGLAQYSTGTPIDDRSLRHAVASCFVITYFTVAVTFFFTKISPETEFAKDLLSNFTTLMITVVGFYLGSTALLEAVERRERGKTDRVIAVQASGAQNLPSPDPGTSGLAT